jgi:hypothetical protein
MSPWNENIPKTHVKPKTGAKMKILLIPDLE